MYTERNFRTKKALREYFESGKDVWLYQEGPFGGKPINGDVYLEGPHYPEPHAWYAQGTATDSHLNTLKGSTAYWDLTATEGSGFVPAKPKVKRTLKPKAEDRAERMNTMYRNIVGTHPPCPKCNGESLPFTIWNMGNADPSAPDFEDAFKCRDCDYVFSPPEGERKHV